MHIQLLIAVVFLVFQARSICVPWFFLSMVSSCIYNATLKLQRWKNSLTHWCHQIFLIEQFGYRWILMAINWKGFLLISVACDLLKCEFADENLLNSLLKKTAHFDSMMNTICHNFFFNYHLIKIWGKNTQIKYVVWEDGEFFFWA